MKEKRKNKTKQKKINKKIKKYKKQKIIRRDGSYSERVRAKWFCCAFKLGFLQLICKGSLIFKSNLELPLSIIFKQRELYESKHVEVECRCLKIWDLISFLLCSSILVFKLRHVSPISLELQQVQVNLYTRKNFKSLGIAFFIRKIIFNFEWIKN